MPRRDTEEPTIASSSHSPPARGAPPLRRATVARRAADLGDDLRRRGETLAVAESCTGGLVGALLTAAPGSSDYFLGGVIAYADPVKVALLGVAPEVLVREGAVNRAVAGAMAVGARARLGATWAIAITGIAGPGGGSDAKPVGLVYVARAGPDGVAVERHMLAGGREAVRLAAAAAALELVARATG